MTMKVKDLMVKDPITISEGASIEGAIQTMKANQIRHLPVVDPDGRLKGLVTLADLKEGLIPSMLSGLSLSDLIIREPITVSPEDHIERAARRIYRHKIGGMPVVEGDLLVGILTETDLFRAFLVMMGVLSGDSRLEIILDDTAEALNRAIGIINAEGGEILSVSMTAYVPPSRTCCFRLKRSHIAPIAQALESAGFQIVEASD